ncbi:DUF922 domain-containing protein [Pontibacter chitinilyticus]|uniref:DUF922 domain-containing protein n=1 Tax=Pontibacter chitinilyticus TaxID=2674989 RepID=UPI00321B5595
MFTFILLLYLWAGIATPAYDLPALPNSLHLPEMEAAVSHAHAVATKEQLAWSPSRRLSWNDFKGVPQHDNPHHALTAANLTVDAHRSHNALDYDVRCVFLPSESWTKNNKSEKLLQHEQLHFDLTEIYARLLRKKLRLLSPTCPDFNQKLSIAVSDTFHKWKAEQEAFDTTSNHGLQEEVEQVWATHIAQRLEELKAYQ